MKSLTKRKLLWNTQAPLPIMSSSLCSSPSPSITDVSTVVQNTVGCSQPGAPSQEVTLLSDSRHPLTHKQPASAASVCTTGIIRSSASCFRKSQGSLYTAQHLPLGVPTHTSVRSITGVASFLPWDLSAINTSSVPKATC